MKRRSLSAFLALSLLILTSCGSRQISTSGDTTADVEPPQTQQTEQTEAVEQAEPTVPVEPTELVEPTVPVLRLFRITHPRRH